MPIDFRGMNSDYVDYFSMEEYVDRIRLMPELLSHLESTNRDFDNYMRKLAMYDEDYIIEYWISLLYQELSYNQRIENPKFNMLSLEGKSVFFDTLNINHKRIHDLHNFVIKKEIEEGTQSETFEYRDVPVNVSAFDECGNEEIFWRGVNPEDVNKFMNDFIKIYKHGATSLLYSNPFLASALMHLLFLRIHPYTDGNGRTSRVIHNIKFTEMVNKLYGTRLKLSPLNLSGSILVNKITYVKRIDNIYFDLKNDTNESLNKWFDFILDMADERIYVANEKLSRVDSSKIKASNRETSELVSDVSPVDTFKTGMRLSRIKKPINRF